METQFYLLLSLKTPTGYEAYGQYFLNDDLEAAHMLFNELKGTEVLTDSQLHIDLIEAANELPQKIRTKCCCLEEFGYNSKLIAREVFRQKNL